MGTSVSPCCKYDVAVSTACSALDYIVVETTADAQACVAHLRSNNLGVATFLILVLRGAASQSQNPCSNFKARMVSALETIII